MADKSSRKSIAGDSVYARKIVPIVKYRRKPITKTAVLSKEAELEIVFCTGSKIRAVLPASRATIAKESNQWDKFKTPFRITKKSCLKATFEKQLGAGSGFSVPEVNRGTKESLNLICSTQQAQAGDARSVRSNLGETPSHVVSAVCRSPDSAESPNKTRVSPAEEEPMKSAPLSTILLRFQLKFDFPPYSILELRTMMSRIGNVVFLIRLYVNVAVVVFDDMAKALQAVKSTRLGKPRSRASCNWLYPTLENSNLYAAVKHINPCLGHSRVTAPTSALTDTSKLSEDKEEEKL